jgi:hypothetical protein
VALWVLWLAECPVQDHLGGPDAVPAGVKHRFLQAVVAAVVIAAGGALTTPDRHASQLIAARIELLALRAAVPESTVVRSNAFRVLPGRGILTSDEAAAVLVRLPKPTVCSVQAREGVAEIQCLSLDDLATNLRNEVMAGRGFEQDPPLLPDRSKEFLAQQNTARVLCVGRKEELLVSLADAEEWYRTYYNPLPERGGYSMMGDQLDNPYWKGSAKYIAAREKGAAAILEFMPPIVRDQGSTDGFITMGSPTETLEIDELDSAALASGNAGIESNLQTFAEAFAKSGQLPRDSAVRHRLARAAAMMRRVWAGRQMPPAVASFVTRFAGRPR